MGKEIKTICADVFVLCSNCDKVLYEANIDDFVTRQVAKDTAQGHVDSFSEEHQVDIIYLKGKPIRGA